MSKQVYLGVDLGAESGRVIAGEFDGHKIQLNELHRFSNGPVRVSGTLRWNIVGLWNQILKGLTKARQEYGENIVSVGVDTWGVDYVLLDQYDEFIGLAYNYRDSRNHGMVETACQQVPREEIFSQTGLQFMEINSLYQLLATKRDTPEFLDRAKTFLMIPDVFHWLMCGSKVVEFTNATTSQCVNPSTRYWANSLLQKFGLPTEIFPEIVMPGTKLGGLRNDVMTATGLSKIPVVTPATHDTGAAVAAIPTDRTGSASWAYISSGTWSLIGVEVPEAIMTPAALAQNVTNEGGVDNTYRLLKNVMGLWLVQQCRNAFLQSNEEYSYEALTRLASESQPFRSIINPNDNVFLAPDNMVTAIQEWCRQHGEPVPQTPGELIRCALESLALKYDQVLRGIQELSGTPIEQIHIVGGGTHNQLLNQFTSDACGVPVVTGPVEATVMGNLLVQARTAGEISSLSDIRSVVRASSEVNVYEPQNQQQWDEARERFNVLRQKEG